MNERAEPKGILAEGRHEAPLRHALASVVAYRCCNDGDWTMESVSEGIFPITGFRPTDFTCGGLHRAQLVLPEDLDAVRDAVQTAVRAGRPFQAQYRIRHRDGSERWVWEQGKGIYGPTGEAIALEGFITDITEQKRAEQALVEASQRLEAHLENSPLALVEFDPGFRITRWSEAAERLFGWTADEVLGLAVPELSWVHEEDVAGTRQIMADMLAGRRPRNVHVNRNYRRDRTVVFCEWYNSAIYDRAGRLTSILSQVLDITERKRAEEALREADRRKDEFLATLAHELRNPLAPIRNAVEVLRLKALLDPELRAAQGMIERQVHHLVRLVDDLLDLSRITHGRLALRRERAELAVVLEQALEASRAHLECAGHDLRLTLPPVPIYLDADPVRLSQVFVNLLNNACKFTDLGGQIRVSAQAEGAQVIVRVADTGIGVPGEDLSRLFEMFAQRGSARERAQGGLGIGLSLARGLVEMHGGSIEAHSEGTGKGTELVVRLPTLDQARWADPSEASPVEAQPPTVTRRVLVVDDHRDAADSLALLLRALGCEVEVARDGLEAVEAAGRYRPDLLLLDIGMPRLDGYAACRRIREHPWGKNMTVIALTGWGQEDDRRKTQEAGFDGHLVKPVEPEVLLDVLNSWNPTLRTTASAGREPLHGAALLRTSR